MKNAFLILSICCMLSVVASCSGNKKEITGHEGHDHPTASMSHEHHLSWNNEQVGAAFQAYVQLRKALTASDPDDAKAAAALLSDHLDEEQTELEAVASGIANTDELEMQRRLFWELTSKIEPLFRDGREGGRFYKIHCPMAFDSKGAYWFSLSEEVTNPYYGDKMLRCGAVEETIGS
jgi:hypothetical protein